MLRPSYILPLGWRLSTCLSSRVWRAPGHSRAYKYSECMRYRRWERIMRLETPEGDHWPTGQGCQEARPSHGATGVCSGSFVNLGSQSFWRVFLSLDTRQGPRVWLACYGRPVRLCMRHTSSIHTFRHTSRQTPAFMVNVPALLR
jgi:hypothetical protein